MENVKNLKDYGYEMFENPIFDVLKNKTEEYNIYYKEGIFPKKGDFYLFSDKLYEFSLDNLNFILIDRLTSEDMSTMYTLTNTYTFKGDYKISGEKSFKFLVIKGFGAPCYLDPARLQNFLDDISERYSINIVNIEDKTVKSKSYNIEEKETGQTLFGLEVFESKGLCILFVPFIGRPILEISADERVSLALEFLTKIQTYIDSL